jgi:hypothetical protein
MIRSLLALGVVVSLAACGGGEDDLDETMDAGVEVPAETQPMTADTMEMDMDVGVDSMMVDTMESDADSMMDDTLGGM